MSKLEGSNRSNGSSNGDEFAVDSFTRGYVRKKARQLAGKFGFNRNDPEEIEQRMYLKLAKRLRNGDPDDPKWKAFVAITVDRRLASMIRDNEAEKRDHRRVCSVHVNVGTDEEPVELAATIEQHQIPSRRDQGARSDQELAELRMDLAECLAEVPDPRHREFCERLKHDSVSQVARDMEIPRTTLNAWLRKLRQRFEERGLRDYLRS